MTCPSSLRGPIAELNARGIRVFGQGLTTRMPARLTLEDWNLFDDSPAWREATVGTVEERKAKLSDPRTRQALREDFDNPKSSDFIFGELPRYIAREEKWGNGDGRSPILSSPIPRFPGSYFTDSPIPRFSVPKARISELLFERADLEFHRPGAAILMRQMPVRLGDRLGLQQIFIL